MPKLLAAAAALAAALTAAPAAQAAVAAKNAGGDTITFTGAEGEESRLSISLAGGDYVFDDSALVVAAGDGCSSIGGNAECPSPGVARIVVLLGDEDDDATPGVLTVPLRIEGGDGWDSFDGSGGDDTLLGGPGIDQVGGAGGIDAIDGGGDMDLLAGGGQADVVRGGDGADFLNGEDGDDQLFGDAGDDTFVVEEISADDLSGGAGVDEALVPGGGSPSDPPIPVTIDDRADDYGNGSNVRTDVENVTFGFFLGPFIGAVGVTGSDASNTIRGGAGHDQIDGRGGIDFLQSGSGDDRVTARDGGFDRVTCGEGIDTATVDFADDVQECENVDRAPEPAPVDGDRPPSVAFGAPSSPFALIDPARGATLPVVASDDRGVAQVVLLDDTIVAGTDATAPFGFDYRPGPGDVGPNTLILVATDTAGQTATAFQSATVDRFAPGGVSVRVPTARDRRAPYVYRGTGRVSPPSGMPPASACDRGEVTLRVLRARRVLARRVARLSPTCTFGFRFALGRRARRGSGRLRLTAAFGGTDVLKPAQAPARALRAG
ncbi:MAG TPA: hypothetical protein VGW10_11980 [Solirubrobacteraceae bacterium]|nr:hypothetical protein [Solirubrobacteraceae bacterium]